MSFLKCGSEVKEVFLDEMLKEKGQYGKRYRLSKDDECKTLNVL